MIPHIGRKKSSFIGAVAVYMFILSVIWATYVPAEDALINFSYVRNLLEGQGYVYNPLLDPVEGGTPLLWILSLAVGANVVPDIPLLARIYSILAGVLLIWVTTNFAEWYEDSYAPIYISPFVIAVTFTPVHSLVGFSTVAFGAMFALFLYSGIEFIRRPEIRINQALFVFTGTVLSMIRPDGAVLAVSGAILLPVITTQKREATKIVISLGSLLGIFHLSRFVYFGYFFPNPFYVKSSASFISLGSVINITDAFGNYNILLLLITFIGVVYVLDNQQYYKETVFVLFPIIIYSIAYLFITQSQNVAFRFQYPYIIIAVLLLPFGTNTLAEVIERNTPKDLVPKQKTVISTLFLILLVTQPIGALTILNAPSNSINPSEVEVSKNLGAYDNNTMLVTQAGAHAYYSNWNAIDAMGLNNEYIAHNEYSNEYVEQYNPDLIQIYTTSPLPPQCSSEYNSISPEGGTRYEMFEYARDNNYTLASVVALRTGRFNWYFVRPSTENASEIIESIRNANVRTMEYRTSPIERPICD